MNKAGGRQLRVHVKTGHFDDVSIAQVELVARRCGNEGIKFRIGDWGTAIQRLDIDQIPFPLIEVGDRQIAAAEDKRISSAQARKLIAAVAATAIENVCIAVAGDLIGEVRTAYIVDGRESVTECLSGIQCCIGKIDCDARSSVLVAGHVGTTECDDMIGARPAF